MRNTTTTFPPATQTVTSSDCVASLLRDGHRVRVRVRGRSMAPAIPDGAILTMTPATAGTIRLGDVVLYETPDGRTVCHRLLARRHNRQSGPQLGFRGDAFTDPLEWAPGTGIIGRAMVCDRIRLDNRFSRWTGWFHAWGYWMISRTRIKLGAWRRRIISRP